MHSHHHDIQKPVDRFQCAQAVAFVDRASWYQPALLFPRLAEIDTEGQEGGRWTLLLYIHICRQVSPPRRENSMLLELVRLWVCNIPGEGQGITLCLVRAQEAAWLCMCTYIQDS